ncbi:unnamed protein product [Citrullus colocynthis]|uniref:Uncharacterized protein n=1 Tax=Citrullus colocynthis TaxID=252529 RepID=A0ABP0XVH8_9ROSI
MSSLMRGERSLDLVWVAWGRISSSSSLIPEETSKWCGTWDRVSQYGSWPKFQGSNPRRKRKDSTPKFTKEDSPSESPFSQPECSALRQDREKSLDQYQVENSSPPRQVSRWEGTTSIPNVPFDLNLGSLEVEAGRTNLQSRQEATNGSPEPLEVDSVSRLDRAKISHSVQSRKKPKMIKKARIWKEELGRSA